MAVAGGGLVLVALVGLAVAPSEGAVWALSSAFIGYGFVQAAVFARIAELARDAAAVARMSGCYTQLGNAAILVAAPIAAAAGTVLGAIALPLTIGLATLGIVGLSLASAWLSRTRTVPSGA